MCLPKCTGGIKKKTIPFHKEIRYNTKTDNEFGKKCSSYSPNRQKRRACRGSQTPPWQLWACSKVHGFSTEADRFRSGRYCTAQKKHFIKRDDYEIRYHHGNQRRNRYKRIHRTSGVVSRLPGTEQQGNASPSAAFGGNAWYAQRNRGQNRS